MKNRTIAGAMALLMTVFCSAGVAAQATAETPLVPKPVERTFSEGSFSFANGVTVNSGCEEGDQLCRYLLHALYTTMPDAIGVREAGRIELAVDPSLGLPAEGYELTVADGRISIAGADRGGLFYGIQTLMQLLPAQIYSGERFEGQWSIPAQKIRDYPRFAYRGAHLDVSRTFSDKQRVMDYIDRMARHKLNKFHWHLTDDEGWRIELKSHPELVSVAAWRGGDSPVEAIYGEWDKKYGGYFTQDEIREVVAYAAMRNIDVIPEIDLPGHSRATAKAMPHILCGVAEGTAPRTSDRRNVWCAAKENNYKILEEIISEVSALFPYEYFHVGGDEVETPQWEKCPDCQALKRSRGYAKTIQIEDYFMERVIAIVEGLGKKAFVWDEAAETGRISKNTAVSGWQTPKACLNTTSKGYKTVVMPGMYFYFDMKQSVYEDGMTWAAIVDPHRAYTFSFADNGFTQEHMKNVMGVEGAFWAELYLSHDVDYLWYQTYPRLCALAEVGWSEDKARDWDDFYTRLTGGHLDRLTAMGIPYRQFPPQVEYRNGTITASAPFEGVEIRYTTDGTDPDRNSTLYTGPIADNRPEHYLFSTFYANSHSGAFPPSARFDAKIGANETKTINIPLKEIIDSEGTWIMRIDCYEKNMKLNKVTLTAGGSTTTIIGGQQRLDPTSRIRIRAGAKTGEGTIAVTVKNENPFACQLPFRFERSPYIEPAVTVTTSMGEAERFPLKNAQDYNFSTYSRTSRAPKKGDHITFTFAQPVDAQTIYLHTGYSYLPRLHIPFGRVQVSADGQNFTDIAQLHAGYALISPEGKVKAVRVMSDSDGNSETTVAIQDLKVRPRR